MDAWSRSSSSGHVRVSDGVGIGLWTLYVDARAFGKQRFTRSESFVCTRIRDSAQDTCIHLSEPKRRWWVWLRPHMGAVGVCTSVLYAIVENHIELNWQNRPPIDLYRKSL